MDNLNNELVDWCLSGIFMEGENLRSEKRFFDHIGVFEKLI